MRLFITHNERETQKVDCRQWLLQSCYKETRALRDDKLGEEKLGVHDDAKCIIKDGPMTLDLDYRCRSKPDVAAQEPHPGRKRLRYSEMQCRRSGRSLSWRCTGIGPCSAPAEGAGASQLCAGCMQSGQHVEHCVSQVPMHFRW